MKETTEKLPTMIIERPKMPRSTWEALRAHIVRERLRKKQEQEQTQEFERQKKEREYKKKQEALTLEETKEQIAQLEAQLNQHKEEKHQLFHTLKKVLYEDETRRRSKEVVTSQVAQPHVYLQPSSRPGGSGHGPSASSMYMKPHPHSLMPPSTRTSANSTPAQSSSGPLKRPKSPSPVHVAPYYRPPSGPGMSLQTVPGVPAPKYVVYTTATTGSPNHMSGSVIYSSSPAPPRPAHLPAHYSSYPGAAAASIGHGRLVEEERNKQQLYLSTAAAQATANYLNSAAASASVAAQQAANYLNSATAAANANAAARTFERQQAVAAAVVQMQQRAAVAAVLANAQQQQQQQQQPPPAAHGGGGQSFRPGSIMTGFPRYPTATTSSTSTSSVPRMAHASPKQRYYRE